MGLKEYWLWIIAAQFLLQSLVLFLLLLSLAPRGGDRRARPMVLKALAITLATVLLESWLTWSLGWIILVPILGVTVLVMMNASWESLWCSCIAVSLFGGFFACLTLDFSEITPRHLREMQAEREARKARAVVRYQQVAGELDRIAPQATPSETSAAPAPVKPPEAADATPAVKETAPPLHLESRLSLADRLAADGIAPAPLPAAKREAIEKGWRIARSLVDYNGVVGSGEGDQVLLINKRLYRRHFVLKIICQGTVYRWFIVKGDTYSLDLKRLSSCSASTPKASDG